jgi:hypothetical protein
MKWCSNISQQSMNRRAIERTPVASFFHRRPTAEPAAMQVVAAVEA